MFSHNSIYPLPSDGALSANINGDHDHVSSYKSSSRTGLNRQEHSPLAPCLGQKSQVYHLN